MPTPPLQSRFTLDGVASTYRMRRDYWNSERSGAGGEKGDRDGGRNCGRTGSAAERLRAAVVGGLWRVRGAGRRASFLSAWILQTRQRVLHRVGWNFAGA